GPEHPHGQHAESSVLRDFRPSSMLFPGSLPAPGTKGHSTDRNPKVIKEMQFHSRQLRRVLPYANLPQIEPRRQFHFLHFTAVHAQGLQQLRAASGNVILQFEHSLALSGRRVLDDARLPNIVPTERQAILRNFLETAVNQFGPSRISDLAK